MLQKNKFQYIVYFTSLLLFYLVPLKAQTTQDSTSPVQSANKLKDVTINPSNWLLKTENALILIENKLLLGYDSSFMNEEYDRLVSTYILIRKDFSTRGEFMRLRTLDDTKAELIHLNEKVEDWRKRVSKINTEITNEIITLHQIREDSAAFSIQQDTTLARIYSGLFSQQSDWIEKIDRQCQDILGKFVGIENRLNNLTFNIATLIAEIDKRILITKNSFLSKTHPAIWELNRGTYSEKIGTVIGETVKQNLDSLSFYGKQAYIRAILFRLFVLAITMLPILYFRRQKKKKDFNINNTNYSLLHKYTGTAAASFAMVMAPFIFINAPHIVIEVIFVTLTITTSHIFLKENPAIKKSNYYIVMISFIIMLLLNLLVSVTLFGRIFWSFSILLSIPLYRIYFDIDRTNLRNKILNKVIIFLTILMIIAGWIMSITGHFPYGRILVLNGLANFFLAIVLYVAIYAFIDFLKILADIYNSRNTVSQIRVDLIYSKLVNIVTFLAVIFWISSFLKNINVYPFLKKEISEWFGQTTNIAGYSINFSSVLVFIFILFFAIYISGLLKGLFYDEQRSAETDGKTNLGSYALLLRLFIISTGFILGMIVTGIDLSKINLIIGALGVGIGFGLQNIINNMVSGLILAFERPIFVGDIIELDGVRGRVTDIGLRATTVDSMEGAEFIIPNGELISKKMKNWTLSSKNFKIDIQITVGLENKVEDVIETLNKAIQQTTSIQQNPLPKVSLKEIQTKGLDFSVTCWVNDISKAGMARNDLLKNIHTALKEKNIVYPQNRDAIE